MTGTRRGRTKTRIAKGEFCTCDYYPENCKAHPHAMHAMLDDNVCGACGGRGDAHAKSCVEVDHVHKPHTRHAMGIVTCECGMATDGDE